MRPAFVRGPTRQGWVASRGIKGGSATLARSYRGPDNVAGPLLGHLNPAHCRGFCGGCAVKPARYQVVILQRLDDISSINS